jgi:hypothetical protein
MLPADLLLDLLFHPEDGGSLYLQNTGRLLSDYKGLHPGRYYSLNWRNGVNNLLNIMKAVVLMAKNIKNMVFWDVTPCSLVDVRGFCCPCLS